MIRAFSSCIRLLFLLALSFLAQLPAISDRAMALVIVGGQEAEEGQFPWQVYIDIYDPSIKKSYTCGGSIIDDDWVLTAAHCVDFSGAQPAIFYGDIDRTKGDRRDVAEIIVHEEYKGHAGDNDIALLKLKMPISDTPKIKLADKTVERDLVVRGAVLTVSGWGNMWDFKVTDQTKALIAKYDDLVGDFNSLLGSYEQLRAEYNELADLYNKLVSANERADEVAAKRIRGTAGLPGRRRSIESRLLGRNDLQSPRLLRYVEVPPVDLEECNESRTLEGLDAVGDNQMCAAGASGGKDSCYGDSGGPLVVATHDDSTYDDHESFVQVGVVGGGGQCGNPLTPGTYAPVSSFSDWIKDKIGDK